MFLLSLRFFLVLSLAFWPFSSGPKEQSTREPTSRPLPVDSAPFQTIRILLIKKTPDVILQTSSPYEIYDEGGRRLLEAPQMEATSLKSTETGIQLGAQNFRTVMLRFVSQGGGFQVKDRLYRDSILIWKEESGYITVINELPIEDYLRGVLPWEANPKWSAESLKAQAIVSRTYALFKVLERQHHQYDLTSGVMSQVYKGQAIEEKKTGDAILATQGQILTFKGEIFPAYFHSTCGGATTHADSLWNIKPHPALQGTGCDFCRGSKHYRWDAEITRVDIQESLAKHGIELGNLIEINPKHPDRAGRARKFEVIGTGGRKTIQANTFRVWIGPSKFKSTLLESVTKTKTGFQFRGRGWGHGAGLCQYGMKHLGEIGYNAKKILGYYYPQSNITKYW